MITQNCQKNLQKFMICFYNKIICKYLNIEGLERLFNEKYMEFEWNMHLGIDYKGIREIIIEIILSTRSEMHI